MRVALLLVLASCWTSNSTPPVAPEPEAPLPSHSNASVASRPTPLSATEEMLQQMQEFSDRMCACSDQACANQVVGDLTTWSSEVAKRGSDTGMEALDDDQKARASQIATALSGCMVKTMSIPPATP